MPQGASRSRPPAGSAGGGGLRSRSALPIRSSLGGGPEAAAPLLRSPRGSTKAPALAQKLFFRVRDDDEQAVLEALSGGLRDPKSKYLPDQQDLMFFAAARRRDVGGAEVIARQLSDLGVPGNSVDRLRQTPLFFAAREGNCDCATFLVEHHRCDVNHRDIYGQSPFFYAVRESHIDMCRLLLDLGASFDIRDNNKNTAVYYAKGEVAVALARILEERLGRESPLPKALESGYLNLSLNLDVRKALTQGDPLGLEALAPLRKRRRLTLPEAAKASSGPELPLEASPEVDSPLFERPTERPKEARPPPLISQRLAAMQAMVSWASVGTDGAASSYPRHTSRGGGDAAGGARGPPPVAVPIPDKVFAQAGEYAVCSPSVGDAWRLRELEREFVLDHFDVFSDEPWHGQLSPTDWCRLVNVIESEEMARQAIVSIIAGRTPRHSTLQCIHVPRGSVAGRGPIVPSVVGYVHVVNAGGHLDVSHLKVDRAHQRRGLGSLLIAGTIRWAERLGMEGSAARRSGRWSVLGASEVKDLRLVVVVRNAPALALYRALGFEDLSSVQRQDPLGGGTVKWQKMWRPFGRGADASAFARLCEARAAASSRPPPPPVRLQEPSPEEE